MTPRMSQATAVTLHEHYPELNRQGLDSAWEFAWARIAGQVSARYLLPGNIPSVFESAAVLYVAAVCADTAQRQQALLYASSELIAPYAK